MPATHPGRPSHEKGYVRLPLDLVDGFMTEFETVVRLPTKAPELRVGEPTGLLGSEARDDG